MNTTTLTAFVDELEKIGAPLGMASRMGIGALGGGALGAGAGALLSPEDRLRGALIGGGIGALGGAGVGAGTKLLSKAKAAPSLEAEVTPVEAALKSMKAQPKSPALESSVAELKAQNAADEALLRSMGGKPSTAHLPSIGTPESAAALAREEAELARLQKAFGELG